MISLVLLCLVPCVFSSQEWLDLQDDLVNSLKKLDKIESTLKGNLTVDLQSWVKHFPESEFRENIEKLSGNYDDIQYNFDQSRIMFQNLVKKWGEKISESDVKGRGNRTEVLRDKLDRMNEALIAHNDTINLLQNEYKELDFSVRTQESQYSNFEQRILDMENKLGGMPKKIESHNQESDKLQVLINSNRNETEKIRVAAKKLKEKNDELEERSKQLHEDIQALRKAGLPSTSIDDEIIATDQAHGKGKTIRLKVVT